jgi:outer membrane biosynthesis protein TonB
MTTAHAGVSQQYRQSVWGTIDPALRNCFIAAGILGLVVLIVIFVTPLPLRKPVSIETVPERIARLILEKPRAVPAAKTPGSVAVMSEPKAEAAPADEPARPKAEKAPPRARPNEPRVAPERGVQGREKARQEVAQNLGNVTKDVDRVLKSVAKSLPATAAPAGTKAADGARRRRGVRSGRDAGQLGSVAGISRLPVADLSGSEIANEGIQIAAITDIAGVDGGAGSGPGVAGAGGGAETAVGGGEAYRSNESLLAVVRRYAPGIQFCYDNELKRNPALRGKLVVAITVLADGGVSEAAVIDDTLRSAAVTQCMLAQIRGWRFPAVPAGVTSFRVPFVFTPPR